MGGFNCVSMIKMACECEGKRKSVLYLRTTDAVRNVIRTRFMYCTIFGYIYYTILLLLLLELDLNDVLTSRPSYL